MLHGISTPYRENGRAVLTLIDKHGRVKNRIVQKNVATKAWMDFVCDCIYNVEHVHGSPDTVYEEGRSKIDRIVISSGSGDGYREAIQNITYATTYTGGYKTLGDSGFTISLVRASAINQSGLFYPDSGNTRQIVDGTESVLSSSDDEYNGYILEVHEGTNSRGFFYIWDYVGASKTIKVYPDASYSFDTTSGYKIFKPPYIKVWALFGPNEPTSLVTVREVVLQSTLWAEGLDSLARIYNGTGIAKNTSDSLHIEWELYLV
jgi:hypothetical protein